MQRRTLFSAALAASAAFSFPALADDFKEGTDYVRLSKPLPEPQEQCDQDLFL